MLTLPCRESLGLNRSMYHFHLNVMYELRNLRAIQMTNSKDTHILYIMQYSDNKRVNFLYEKKNRTSS